VSEEDGFEYNVVINPFSLPLTRSFSDIQLGDDGDILPGAILGAINYRARRVNHCSIRSRSFIMSLPRSRSESCTRRRPSQAQTQSLFLQHSLTPGTETGGAGMLPSGFTPFCIRSGISAALSTYSCCCHGNICQTSCGYVSESDNLPIFPWIVPQALSRLYRLNSRSQLPACQPTRL
jgi:hypothetical protein